MNEINSYSKQIKKQPLPGDFFSAIVYIGINSSPDNLISILAGNQPIKIDAVDLRYNNFGYYIKKIW